MGEGRRVLDGAAVSTKRTDDEVTETEEETWEWPRFGGNGGFAGSDGEDKGVDPFANLLMREETSGTSGLVSWCTGGGGGGGGLRDREACLLGETARGMDGRETSLTRGEEEG